MTTIKDLLTVAADADRVEADPLADLVRGQDAYRARNRRLFRTGLTAFTLVAVLGAGTAGILVDRAGDTSSSTVGVQLVAAEFEATPYTFDLTPVGWSLQAQKPSAVTIAPDDGSTSDHPDDFVGKLVILFDANPPIGKQSSYGGRTLWISESEEYVTMATLARSGEPAGVVRIQYPRDAGWSEASMEAFLASVHVGDTARHGLG